MQPIPEDILKQFNAVLAQKAVSSSLQDEYRKWLKYYLDFRVKYPPPDSKSNRSACLSKRCAQKESPERLCIKEVASPLDF